MVALVGYTQKEPYSTESAINSLWDKYEDEVQSTQAPGGDFQAIDVTVYDKKDINKVENHLVITASAFYHLCHLLYQCLTSNLPRSANLFTSE